MSNTSWKSFNSTSRQSHGIWSAKHTYRTMNLNMDRAKDYLSKKSSQSNWGAKSSWQGTLTSQLSTSRKPLTYFKTWVGIKEKWTILVHKSFVNRVISLGDSKFASCSNDFTVKIWKLGNKKPLKSVKFPTYVYTIETVSDEFGVKYLVASLAYDDTTKGDLLSVKLDTLQ